MMKINKFPPHRNARIWKHLCCKISLRAARHAALAAGSGGDRKAYPKGKQSLCWLVDCFATLAMTEPGITTHYE